MSDAAGYDILQWDSATFGFPVARIRPAAVVGMTLVVDALRARGVRLAYLTCPEADRETQGTALAHGCTPVDVRMTFVASLREPREPERTREATIVPYPEPVADETLVNLARQSGEFSRFRTDPRVGRHVFEAIYDAWIRNSVERRIADEVLVAISDGRTVGLVTVARRGEQMEIGLLAVDAQSRGRGVGRALVSAALGWGKAAACTRAVVVTQQANQAACRLYESCGYHVGSVECVFHLWL